MDNKLEEQIVAIKDLKSKFDESKKFYLEGMNEFGRMYSDYEKMSYSDSPVKTHVVLTMPIGRAQAAYSDFCGGHRVSVAQQRNPCLSSPWMDCGVKRLVPDFMIA